METAKRMTRAWGKGTGGSIKWMAKEFLEPKKILEKRTNHLDTLEKSTEGAASS